jgi:hypothetical protein
MTARGTAEPAQQTYLLVIGEREALAWILANQQMAFPDFRRREVKLLAPGDALLIYTTRGCFRNPTIDQGRVIGEALVAGPVRALDEPLVLNERSFPVGCPLSIQSLTPLRDGVELRDMVGSLESLPDTPQWGWRLRRPLLSLPRKDAAAIRRRLDKLTVAPKQAMAGYLRWLPDSALMGTNRQP